MDRIIKGTDIILLFDRYSANSHNLYKSFRQAGYDGPAIVIEDEGFLPDGVNSIYSFFLGDFKKILGDMARPKYFWEIVVPEYWKISENDKGGTICDLSKERGRFYYANPSEKRFVKRVDWYDENGIVRYSEHYNRYGVVYARTIYSAQGQQINKSWFSVEGQEIIVENYITGDIILNIKGKIKFFQTKMDFILYLFVKSGFEQRRIFFNSLSTPFFLSQRLSVSEKSDVLFWQEPVGDEIPGNMQFILNGYASRTSEIIVQQKDSYKKLIELGARENMLHRLGFIYSFVKDNKYKPEALICTNSDQIEHCREMIEARPEMQFHIAAHTLMSDKLMSLEIYDNVMLYPSAKMEVIDDLFQKCDFYLDINYGTEIVSAVQRAFLNNHLIVAFQETIHNRNYIADTHVYPIRDFDRMIFDIRAVTKDRDLMGQYLKKQHEFALAEEKEAYVKLLEC